MEPKITKKPYLPVIGLILLLGVLLGLFFLGEKLEWFGKKEGLPPSDVSLSEEARILADRGEVFSISSGDSYPRFSQKLIIHPFKDVEIGETQSFSIWAEDPEGIEGVMARIQTGEGKERIATLKLVEGTKENGKWQGSWKVKDVSGLPSYSILFQAVNKKGGITELSVFCQTKIELPEEPKEEVGEIDEPRGFFGSNVAYAAVVTKTYTGYSTTQDGHLEKRSSDYHSARNASTADFLCSANLFFIGQAHYSQYQIYRSFVFFDTSSIPTDATISSATLSIRKHAGVPYAAFDIVIQNGQPTYPHDPLVHRDYDRNHYWGNGGSVNMPLHDMSTGWKNITLNSSGRGWIQKGPGAMTKLCLRSSRDINGNPPGINPEYVMFYTSENGAGYQPTLTVTYTVDVPEIPQISVTPASLSFGDVEIGSHKDLTFTVQNTGTGTLSGSVSGLVAPFSCQSGCSYNLSASASQTTTIRFSPTSTGSFSDTAVFSGAGGANRGLSGTGVRARCIPSGMANQDYNITSNCVIDGEEGLEGGDIIIGSGVTLQINENSSLIFNPGQSIFIEHNAYILKSANNAVIKKGHISVAGFYTLKVYKSGTGSGTVTGSGINCGSDCSESYTSGTSVTLTASPSSGSTFAGWSGGGCSGTGTCTVTMDSDKSVTATFNIIPPTCISHSYKSCYDNDVYWYDSCDNREEKYQECYSDSWTNNYRCSGDWRQRQKRRRGCSGSSCYDYYEWVNYEDCAAQGKVCQDGQCIAVSKPDLVITSISFRSDRRVQYTIKNFGNATAGSSYSMLEVNGASMATDAVGSLSAGSSSNEYFAGWTCTAGTSYNLSVCADYNSLVSESNEGNNCAIQTLTCPAPPPPPPPPQEEVNLPSCPFSAASGVWARAIFPGWSWNDRCKMNTSCEKCKNCWTGSMNAQELVTRPGALVTSAYFVGFYPIGWFTASWSDLCVIPPDNLPACSFGGKKGDVWAKPYQCTWSTKCKLGTDCSRECSKGKVRTSSVSGGRGLAMCSKDTLLVNDRWEYCSVCVIK